MVKPTDFSKFRKNLTKSVDGIAVGFHDPTTWIHTGNYCLNYTISKRFDRGVPLGQVTMLAGESGCLPETAKVNIRFKKDEWSQQEVTVKELKEMYHSGKYDIEIETPDGMREITNWFNKGPLKLYKIETKNHRTECAYNHLIEKKIGFINKRTVWEYAKNLVPGDKILTKSGIEKVRNVKELDKRECYDFTINHPNHRYWGDGISSHNSGKSYISAHIMRNAQEQGIFVVAIDTENGLTQEWLEKAGVYTDEDKFMRIQAALVDDVAKTIHKFMEDYKQLPEEERPKVLFVIDSLGMLVTKTDMDQFKEGDLKGDMGRKPKALNALIRNCIVQFAEYDVGLVATNHTYASQDMFNPEPQISGGQGFVFASTIVVAMQKLKLKEDEEGKKISDVRGIRSKIKCVKTRYNKPFESVEVKIPYSSGMDPYSGLVEFFENQGLLEKDGNKLKYIDLQGQEHKYFRKNIPNSLLDQMMDEYALMSEKKEKEQETQEDQEEVQENEAEDQ